MCLGACGTVAGVRERSRVRRVGGKGWGEKADQGLNFPALSGASSDFLVMCLRGIFLAAVQREGGREPDEGWGTDEQAIAMVKERRDGTLNKTMAVRMERR